MSVDLSIIIINWKSREYVRGCLESVKTNAQFSLEIIVIDNASFDGVGKMLAEEYPEVTFLQSHTNLGFAAANNLAYGKSTARNVLFLNPDTKIQQDALPRLLASLESRPQIGIVGCRLLNSDLSLQTTSVTALPSLANQLLDSDVLKRTFPTWTLWGQQALWRNNDDPIQVQAISGACMLARREALDAVGGFSSEYFMYAEDMDLCLRVTQAGWSILYNPLATIVHYGGGSSARRESSFNSLALRISITRFFYLHRGYWYALCYRVCMAINALIRMIALVFAFPLVAPRRGFSFASQPMHKWWTIFLWSVGVLSSEQYRPATRSSHVTHPVIAA